ncbi:hypothetical protein Tco_1223251 [Tanacetum coccineum]
MLYPRFTKVIVDYFMAKDPSISRRNKMFWHTARDDFMFTTIRVISKHQDTQIYGANLPQHLTNQAMLESEAYKTYHAYATGEKTPKPKKKKADSESSPKEKPAQALKGKRLKTSSKAAQSTKEKQHATKSKSKGLTVLSEVTLTEDEQMKLATKRSRIQTHSSHASGSGDRVDTLSKVPDEQLQKKSGTDEGAGDDDDDANEESDAHDDSDENESDDEGDDFVHLNLSTYTTDDQDKEENQEEEKAEDDEDLSDQRVYTPPDYQLTEESEEQEGDDKVEEREEEHEDEEMIYGDLNLNRERNDADMLEAQATKNTEDAHVTLTAVTPIVQQQSSSVSDLVSKFINPSTDEGIDSVLNQNIQSDALVDIPVTATTKTPPTMTTTFQPPFPNIHSLQQTPNLSTSTTFPTTNLPEIPNFASLFGFEQRVSSLEIELSELKQTNQFVEVVSSIPGIVDNYLASKMKEAVDVEQVKAQTSKIMSKVEKYVTKTLGAEVLVRSTNQPQTSYAVASLLSELELKKILIDKIEENKSIDRSEVQKNLYNALVKAYNTDKDIISIYGKETESTNEPTHKESRITSSPRGASRSQPTDLDDLTHQEFNTGDKDVTPTREAQDEQLLTKPTYDLMKGSCKSVAELEYHLEEVSKATNDQLDWNNSEGTPYPHDLSKPLPLILNARGHLVIPFNHFIKNNLEYIKGGSLSHKYTTSITKTKAADCGQIKWIKDKIPRSM